MYDLLFHLIYEAIIRIAARLAFTHIYQQLALSI